MTTPVWLTVPLAKRKPIHVWSWAPLLKLMPPIGPPPASNVTPPMVSARTVTARVREAKREPIHSEFGPWLDEALILYVPFATTIWSTVLSARADSSARIDLTRTEWMAVVALTSTSTSPAPVGCSGTSEEVDARHGATE